MTHWRCQPRSQESQSIMSSVSGSALMVESQPVQCLQLTQHQAYALTRETTRASAKSMQTGWPLEPQFQHEMSSSRTPTRFRRAFPLQNAHQSARTARSIVASPFAPTRRTAGTVLSIFAKQRREGRKTNKFNFLRCPTLRALPTRLGVMAALADSDRHSNGRK